MTLFALLELYKRGEADWVQDEPFGDVRVDAGDGVAPAEGGRVIARRRSRRCCSCRPIRCRRASWPTRWGGGGRGRRGRSASSRRLDGHGIVLRELAGGWTLASHPDAEEAARRLLARPRTPVLTPAQAETLSIVAYLQPVSRPEVARIRGVACESAAAALLERGLIEESGRSQFGAILYRTTPLFLKLFGLDAGRPPEPGPVGPVAGGAGALRDRLLRAGEARVES